MEKGAGRHTGSIPLRRDGVSGALMARDAAPLSVFLSANAVVSAQSVPSSAAISPKNWADTQPCLSHVRILLAIVAVTLKLRFSFLPIRKLR